MRSHKETDESPRVAFLILCWNNKDLLDECLQSVQNQTYKNISIYVNDHASEDGSAAYVKEHYPEVHLIESTHNYGFAKGNNIMVREALKDPEVGYMALVNTDAFLSPDWAQKLVAFALTRPKAAGLQGLTIDYYNHLKVDSHHIYIRDDLQAVQYGYGDPNDDEQLYTTKVFGVNAAAAMYSRRFIEAQPKQRLFEEKLFMYLEDVDASFRAIVGGWENYFVKGPKAYHMGSVSAKKKSSQFSIYMTFRNQTAVLFRNLPLSVFWHCFRRALRFEMVFYRHTLKHSGRSILRAVIKGRLIGLLRLPLYISDRRYIQKNRKVPAEYILQLIYGSGFFK